MGSSAVCNRRAGLKTYQAYMQLNQQNCFRQHSDISFIKVNEQNDLGSIKRINTGGIFITQSVTEVLLLFLEL